MKHLAEQYATDIISGKIAACKYVKFACERYFNDYNNQVENGWKFSKQDAQRVINFFERVLKHFQGKWAGKQFILEPWQQFIIWNLYGWKRSNGLRRFNRASVFVPRKNGKTELAVGCGLYAMCYDKENAAEVYSTATDKDQAKIAFQKAKAMVQQSNLLLQDIKPLANALFSEKYMSTFKPWSSDTGSKDGYNPSFAIVDEYHAHKDNSMMEVIESGLGAREQPIIFAITTAGFNIESVAYKHQLFCQEILEGKKKQDNLFTIIYSVDDEDKENWDNPDVWEKANPSFKSIDTIPSFMSEMYDKALNTADNINFLTKNLNIWTRAQEVWIPDTNWQNCYENFTEKELAGQLCFGGLDLSDSFDLTALALYFPDSNRFIWRFWLPEEKLHNRLDGIDYLEWVNDGFITVTPGNVIDYDYIRKEISGYQVIDNMVEINDKSLSHVYSLQSIAYDRWGATQLSINLTNDGINLTKFGQGYVSMSHPTKEFKKNIIGNILRHNGNPVIRWMLGNVSISIDPAGNIKCDKKKSRQKIDGIVASVMALGEGLQYMNNSYYDSINTI